MSNQETAPTRRDRVIMMVKFAVGLVVSVVFVGVVAPIVLAIIIGLADGH